jgi:hypothetical protein
MVNTKDWSTRTPPKSGSELRCYKRVSCSCSTRHVTLVNGINLVIKSWKKKVQEIVTMTNRAYPWWYVTQIFTYLVISNPSSMKSWGLHGRDQLPMQSVPITTDVVSLNLDQGEVYNIMWYSLSVTCDRSVVFPGSSGFLHQWNWPPWYNWNIVESGVKHHQTNKQTTSMKSW